MGYFHIINVDPLEMVHKIIAMSVNNLVQQNHVQGANIINKE